MAPSDLFPFDEEIDELLVQQALAHPASERSTSTTESLPSSPINEYVIFKARDSLPYEDMLAALGRPRFRLRQLPTKPLDIGPFSNDLQAGRSVTQSD